MPQPDKRKNLSDQDFGKTLDNLIKHMAQERARSAGVAGDTVEIELKFKVHFTKESVGTERQAEVCCYCTYDYPGDSVWICRGAGSRPCCNLWV